MCTCSLCGSIDGVPDGLDGLALTVMGTPEHSVARGVVGDAATWPEH